MAEETVNHTTGPFDLKMVSNLTVKAKNYEENQGALPFQGKFTRCLQGIYSPLESLQSIHYSHVDKRYSEPKTQNVVDGIFEFLKGQRSHNQSETDEL